MLKAKPYSIGNLFISSASVNVPLLEIKNTMELGDFTSFVDITTKDIKETDRGYYTVVEFDEEDIGN